MTDAEKFSRVTQIIQDQMALEKSFREQAAPFEEIQFSRADAYRHIVDVVVGPNALLRLTR